MTTCYHNRWLRHISPARTSRSPNTHTHTHTHTDTDRTHKRFASSDVLSTTSDIVVHGMRGQLDRIQHTAHAALIELKTARDAASVHRGRPATVGQYVIRTTTLISQSSLDTAGMHRPHGLPHPPSFRDYPLHDLETITNKLLSSEPSADYQCYNIHCDEAGARLMSIELLSCPLTTIRRRIRRRAIDWPPIKHSKTKTNTSISTRKKTFADS